MQDFKKNLAAVIRQARKEQGLSQEKLAEALGVGIRTIMEVRSNHEKNPRSAP